MRSRYALVNTIAGVSYQLVNGIINLILRRMIISTVGIDFLGVNGLFTNVLQLLGLVESGFGVAIVYMLYKPIAENDEIQIAKYLNYFAKMYRMIAVIVLIVGMVLAPLLKFIIPENPFTYKMTVIYYLLFLLNTVSSYFLAYKQSFLNACQRQYYVSLISIISGIIFAVMKCMALLIWENYIVYLLLIVANTCFINILISILVDKKYKYLKTYRKEELQNEYKNKIRGNVNALLYHKIGGYILNGTDNLVITYFVGLSTVGIYSNYVLVISMLNIFINQVFTAIVPAFGSIIAEDNANKTNRIYDVFRISYFVSFLLYGTCSLILCAAFQPFVIVWTGGEQYTLNMSIVYLIILNFYLGGMRAAPSAVKTAAGIYRQDKFSPVCESIINLIISIGLAYKFGVVGVIVGTIVSGLAMPFWTAPYYVYRDLFHIPFTEFLKKAFIYFLYLILGVLLVNIIYRFIDFSGTVISFLSVFLASLVLVTVYMLVIFMLSNEREGLLPYIKNILIGKRG